MKILQWNIHGAAGYGAKIPNFILKELLSKGSDIIILNEFVNMEGWEYLKSGLEKEYRLFWTENKNNKNGILIGTKGNIKSFDFNSLKITEQLNTNIVDKPDFLQLEFKSIESNISFFIIGTRIRDTGKMVKINQIEALKQHIDSLPQDKILIAAGDFNVWPGPLTKKIGQSAKVYSPKYSMIPYKFNSIDTWSAILPPKKENLGKALLDHLVVKNINVSNVMYSWDFVTDQNGYGNLTAEDYKSHLKGLPDHAILTADVLY